MKIDWFQSFFHHTPKVLNAFIFQPVAAKTTSVYRKSTAPLSSYLEKKT